MPASSKPNSRSRLKKKAISVYVEDHQQDALRALSAATRVPQQVYIREGLDLVLAKYASPPAGKGHIPTLAKTKDKKP
jgi:hypothetical protein